MARRSSKSTKHAAPFKRVTIIGLDGADPALLEKFVAAGRLPTLARLMNDGVFSPLKSTIPPHSGPAWAAFATGCNPGKSGIVGFLKKTPGVYAQEPVFAGDVVPERMWNAANRHRKTAGLINIPLTYPPEKIDGYMMSGLPMGEDYFYPKSLFAEIAKSVVRRWEAPQIIHDWDDCYRKDLARDLINKNMLLSLRAERPVDLEIIVFELIDRIQHRYWHCMDDTHPAHRKDKDAKYADSVATAYEIADRLIAELIAEQRAGELLLIVSDHGFRPCARSFHLNRFLIDESYIALSEGFDPAAVKSKNLELLYSRTDWERTSAFMVNDELVTSAGIQINLEGREQHGTVAPGDEYESVRTGLLEKLREVIDPETGEKVFEGAYRREEIYSGPRVEDLPDIILVSQHRLAPEVAPDALFSAITPNPPRTDPLPKNLTAHHAPFGIFIAHGENVKGKIETAGITDIAPTVLHALGLPVPRGMDGAALPIFGEPFCLESSVQYEDPPAAAVSDNADEPREISEQEKKKAMQVLKGLKYID